MSHSVFPPFESGADQRRAVDVWIYFVLGQLGWIVCVMGAAHGMGWVGSLFVAAAVAFHLLHAGDWTRELRLVLAAVAIGWPWESVLVHAGWLVYPDGGSVAPYWMAGLWALLAIQLNVLFVWLRAHMPLAVLTGAVAGPLSFRAGAALGAVHFPDTVTALTVLAAGWAVLLPLMLLLARRWDGVHADQRRANR